MQLNDFTNYLGVWHKDQLSQYFIGLIPKPFLSTIRYAFRYSISKYVLISYYALHYTVFVSPLSLWYIFIYEATVNSMVNYLILIL